MSAQAVVQTGAVAKPAFTPVAGGVLQRACACGQHSGNGGECEECKKKREGMLQRSATHGAPVGEVPPIVHDVLRSPGRPLDIATRAFMESRFGHDFSRVRVHTDAKAANSARVLDALAYTVGHDVVFGWGQYMPSTSDGKSLLAHELTHVLQQSKASLEPQTKLTIGGTNDVYEQEADRVAKLATADKRQDSPLAVGQVSINLQRACGPAAIGAPAGCVTQNPVFISGYPTFKFNSDCDDLEPGEQARLIGAATAVPAAAVFEIHGFSGTIGDAAFNQNLSCARALKVRSLLTDASPVGAGIAPARIVGIFKHGPTPGPAGSRRVAVITPARATQLPAAVPAPGATDFQINRVGSSTTSRIFFSSGSAALDTSAVARIRELRVSPPGSVRLIGYASANEPASVAQDRANAVSAALAAPAVPASGASPAQSPVPVTSAVGNAAATASRSSFTQVRSVEILVGAAAPTTTNCAETNPITGALINPPKQSCTVMDPPTWTAFGSALAIAQNAMGRAVAAVAGVPSAANAAVIDRFFGNHSAATLSTLRTNLGNLQTHVNSLPGITQCGGQCDIGGCDEGPIAYNSGVDAGSTMTLCVPVFKGMHINDRARNLIHESAHGTSPLGAPIAPSEGTRDVAYRHERILFQLAPADRLRNSDSYALFALFLREVQITGSAAAVPAGIGTPASDTLTGFGSDEPALRLALARLEKRLTWATDWSGQLYGQINQVRTGAVTWAASWAQSLMRETSSRFPLTAPPATPNLADQTRVAAINDRYERMKRAVKTDLSVTRVTTGTVRWPPSAPNWIAGDTLEIGADFFRATTDDQVALLLENLARATRDVEPAYVPAYVSLAEWIHRQNP
jgi:outer membrane protein OmpA-like peptidoglycan-associated protein